jgi:hypothetical protein
MLLRLSLQVTDLQLRVQPLPRPQAFRLPAGYKRQATQKALVKAQTHAISSSFQFLNNCPVMRAYGRIIHSKSGTLAIENFTI